MNVDELIGKERLVAVVKDAFSLSVPVVVSIWLSAVSR